MTIDEITGAVQPLTQIIKTNEIIRTVNDNLNMYYSTTNPTLTPSGGKATWTVTHNLGTYNVNCSLYKGEDLIVCNIATITENSISVSFYASSTVTADTYKIVVISNGANASSGGGGESYTLPVATTSTLGGVKIDGTSITIDDGVISSAVDSTISSTSTNPVQNKVIYPCLNGFLPSGTVINVKTDGTGDFTTIADAINYLRDKWSNGVVTIQLGSGNFTFNSNLIFDFTDISRVRLLGISASETTLSDTRTTLTSNQYALQIKMPYFYISNLSLQGSATSYEKESIGILAEVETSQLTASNVSVNHFNTGIQSTGSKVQIRSNISVTNCNYAAFKCRGAGVLCSNWRPTISLNTAGTGFVVDFGGIISLTSPNISYTSVTTHTSQAVGTITNDGLITGVS